VQLYAGSEQGDTRGIECNGNTRGQFIEWQELNYPDCVASREERTSVKLQLGHEGRCR